jgi:hypothetical protein
MEVIIRTSKQNLVLCIASQFYFSGIYIEGVTPLPIPNREVKPLGADGTMRVTAWESRSMPDFILETRSVKIDRVFFMGNCLAIPHKTRFRFQRIQQMRNPETREIQKT